MFAIRPYPDIISARIHALDPCHAVDHFLLTPPPLLMLAKLRVHQSHHETIHAHRRHLPLRGFSAAISGRSSSATALASSVYWTVGAGANQSQNTLTSSPVVIPVNRASR